MSAGEHYERIDRIMERCRNCKRLKRKDGGPDYCWRHNKKMPIEYLNECESYEPIKEEA